ncbi:MAG TPA: hypothetical protein VGC56_13810 [Allosphingosinicella sp.]|jgi:hypothetical protein
MKSLLILNIAIWVIALLLGLSGYLSIIQQHVHGYPNLAQLELNVLFPLAMLSMSAALVIYRKKLPKSLSMFLAIAAIICILPFLALSSGGV